MLGYAKVYRQIWNDESFRALPEQARQLYLYLLTTPHGNSMGLFIIDDAYIAADLQWSVHAVSRAKKHLENSQMLFSDPKTRLILLAKIQKDNIPENPSVLKNWERLLLSLPKSPLVALFLKCIEPFINSDWGKRWVESQVKLYGDPSEDLSKSCREGMVSRSKDHESSPEGGGHPVDTVSESSGEGVLHPADTVPESSQDGNGHPDSTLFESAQDGAGTVCHINNNRTEINSNSNNKNISGGRSPPNGGKAPSTGALTPAAKYLFEKTGRKRWQNLVQKEEFEKAEQEVGEEGMKKAIDWALLKGFGLSQLQSILTVARKGDNHGKTGEPDRRPGTHQPDIARRDKFSGFTAIESGPEEAIYRDTS